MGGEEEGVFPAKPYSEDELPWWSVVVMDGFVTDGIRSPRKNANFDNTTFHDSSIGLVVVDF